MSEHASPPNRRAPQATKSRVIRHALRITHIRPPTNCASSVGAGRMHKPSSNSNSARPAPSLRNDTSGRGAVLRQMPSSCDADNGSRHVACLRSGQQHECRRQFSGLACPPQGRVLTEVDYFSARLGRGLTWRPNRSGRHRVDADSPWPQRLCQRERHVDDGRLGESLGNVAASAAGLSGAEVIDVRARDADVDLSPIGYGFHRRYARTWSTAPRTPGRVVPRNLSSRRRAGRRRSSRMSGSETASLASWTC